MSCFDYAQDDILWLKDDIEDAVHYFMQNTNTLQQYDQVVAHCKHIFIQKAQDYGTSWRVLRTISVVDQIFIKAQRIKTIQEKKAQQVEDGIAAEFQGIINYSVIGLIQLEKGSDIVEDLPAATIALWYDEKIIQAKNIMLQKNHDYGEAWRLMSEESFTDLILMKILRIKQILTNEGKTLISEGIDANYVDILNYAIFASILMSN